MMAPLCKGQQRKPHPNHGSLVQRELSAQLTEGLSVRIPIPRKNAVGSTLPRRLSGFSSHSITPPDKFSTADGFCKHNAIPREKYFLFLRFFYIHFFIFPRRKQKKAQKNGAQSRRFYLSSAVIPSGSRQVSYAANRERYIPLPFPFPIHAVP